MGYFFSLSKSATIHWLDASEWMLLAFGALLAVGIIGEIKHGMWGRPPRFFELIVLWGVLAEVLADGGIFLFSSQLQIISDSENTALRKQTDVAVATAKGFDLKIAEAQRGTADAVRDSATAKRGSDEANALAKRYESGIAEANARIKSAEAQVASANAASKEAIAKAESERLERTKLEAVVSPRRIGADEQKRIKEALKGFEKRLVLVSSNGLDAEAALLGAQIIACFPFSFTVQDERALSISTGGFDFGIHIRGPQSDQDLVTALTLALRSIGKLQTWANTAIPRTGVRMGGSAMKTEGGGSGPTPPGTPVWIEIGVKPLQPVNGLR
jgi:hypothetical protein